jgi:hypothetical protein
MSSIMDRLERICTNRPKRLENKPISKFQKYLNPWLLLQPTEYYEHRLLLRTVLLGVAYVTLIFIIQRIIVFTVIFIQFHGLLIEAWHHTATRHYMIGYVEDRFGYDPFLPLIFFAFMYLISWTRYYFWNRRARRLNEEQKDMVVAEPDLPAAADPAIWPPPPVSPH